MTFDYHLIGHWFPTPVLGVFHPLLVDAHLPVHAVDRGRWPDRAHLVLVGATDFFPVFTRVHDRATVEHTDDQVGVDLFEEDVHRVAVHLDGTVKSPEDARPA